mmetsp:Transcript_5716/g.5914  ORF Transcript_5716/g.5914 Transcript_5716/m.5914 type:complete len:152 (-) Transcript_5716:42-497(-)|eukprot:CAMPEP_0182416714 /NCGR_PEP_ID=MMETSP1167-20130531/1077_1 /TAXON_ID=2988 /ORGANISM="Mallomonas Sp, Strain CCMP3275" /LENGTH=151 /DNA_ID=CAMNT_0024589727 /DNA_START=138 /DNA_END=593 /DNA_ORIENTATION=+
MSHAADDENAAELQFGKEFGDDDVEYIMNDEVLVILEKQKSKLDADGKQSNDTFDQTLTYIRTVTPGVDMESLRANISELRSTLQNMELFRRLDGVTDKLHKYEVASIANLIPQDSTVDEVTDWIPSLTRYDEDQIQQILEKVSRIKSKVI